MRGVNKTKRQNKTKGNSQASAPQGGAEAFKAVSAAVNTAGNAVVNTASANAVNAAQPVEAVKNSEVKATRQEAAPTVEELTRALRSCFTAECQWLCGQITLSMAPELIMEAFVRALEGALYGSPLKDFKFAVVGRDCLALVNLVERKYDGVTRITNVKAAKRL